jgi:hypothetical protein
MKQRAWTTKAAFLLGGLAAACVVLVSHYDAPTEVERMSATIQMDTDAGGAVFSQDAVKHFEKQHSTEEAKAFDADASFWHDVKKSEKEIAADADAIALALEQDVAGPVPPKSTKKEHTERKTTKIEVHKKAKKQQLSPKSIKVLEVASKEASSEDSQANALCHKAKLKIIATVGGSPSKAKRHAALASVLKYCHKVRGIVEKQANHNAHLLGEKLLKPENGAKSSEKETTEIKKAIPSVKHLTGHKVHMDAENQSAAKELQRESKKALVRDTAKAKGACKMAMNKVNSMDHAITTPAQRAHAKKIAKAYCAKMMEVVAHEKALITRDVVRTAKGAYTKATGGRDAHMIAPAPAAGATPKPKMSSMKNVHHVGKMPAKVVKSLETDVHAIEEQQRAEEEKARAMCAKAKAQVKDEEGSSTPQQRAVAVQTALHFCKTAKTAVAGEKQHDEVVLKKVLNSEAKHYGMKVIKMPTDASTSDGSKPGHHVSEVSVEAERKLFIKHVGKQADYAEDKNAVKEAVAEATRHALDKKVKQVKAKVDASLASHKAKADKLCALSKKRIAQLKGAKNATNRAAELENAIQVCHNAQAAIVKEKKMDYAALKSLTHEAHHPKVLREADKKHAAEAKKMAAKHVKKEPPAAHAIIRASQKTWIHHSAQHVAVKIEGSMHAKAAQMCAMMMKKVAHLDAAKQAQAKAFCAKAQKLVAQEIAVDKAALKKAKIKKRRLKADHVEKAAEEHMVAEARLALKKGQHHKAVKPLSAAKKAALEHNKTVGGILKNLQAMKKYKEMISASLILAKP